jgi:hypothetical protein
VCLAARTAAQPYQLRAKQRHGVCAAFCHVEQLHSQAVVGANRKTDFANADTHTGTNGKSVTIADG